MPSLKYLRISAPYLEVVTFLGLLEAPTLEDLYLHSPNVGPLTPRLHAVPNSAVGKYSALQSLTLRGALGNDILRAFPTIHQLRILDDSDYPLQLANIFNPNQDAILTLAPRLASITAPTGYKETIQAFITARRSLGINVTLFIAASDM
ncbi:hypothetical protein HWV62_13092 [Athelia sp. TMB]|nr:hypothetical protein HWV62_13092 [Athelia sp. TMB]